MSAGNIHGSNSPRIVALAGPNGAGKSTTAERLLRGPLAVDEFVNADVIAQGLSGFAPNRVALAAGRVMMARLHELAKQRANFAFETTLASRSFAPWIKELENTGYQFHLMFLWLSSPDIAVARVAERVRLGGHHVPESTIRRRYRAGIHNFFALYQQLAHRWKIVDNSGMGPPRVIAAGRAGVVHLIRNKHAWQSILTQAEQ
jgi:predicted ABC-type ATPase